MIVEETKLVLVSQRIDLQWFAAEDEGRTEQPTEHKLKKAREEGRVPKSQEITGALVLLFPVLVLFMLGSWIFKNCIELVRFYFSHSTEMGLLDGALYRGILEYFTKISAELHYFINLLHFNNYVIISVLKKNLFISNNNFSLKNIICATKKDPITRVHNIYFI